jgi:hypothetical protein
LKRHLLRLWLTAHSLFDDGDLPGAKVFEVSEEPGMGRFNNMAKTHKVITDNFLR